jgi:hypothetical protein
MAIVKISYDNSSYLIEKTAKICNQNLIALLYDIYIVITYFQSTRSGKKHVTV